MTGRATMTAEHYIDLRDELDRLRAENERLRAALQAMTDPSSSCSASEAAMREARELYADDLCRDISIPCKETCICQTTLFRIAAALEHAAAAQRERDAKIAWDFSAEAAEAIRNAP